MSDWREAIARALIPIEPIEQRNRPTDRARPKTLSDPTATANFLGEQAATKDWSAVAIARQMIDEGASRDDIWKATGERGQPQWHDQGRWWHEAMGTPAVDYRQPLDPHGRLSDRRSLGDLLHADSARDSYPWLADIPVTHNPLNPRRAAATYNPERNAISTLPDHNRAPDPVKMEDLVHEQQHAIDTAEGVPRVDAPYMDRPLEQRAYNAAARRRHLSDDDRRKYPPYETQSAAVDGKLGSAFPSSVDARYAEARRTMEESPLPPPPVQNPDLPPLPWVSRQPPPQLTQWRQQQWLRDREREQFIAGLRKLIPW